MMPSGFIKHPKIDLAALTINIPYNRLVDKTNYGLKVCHITES